jgi:hypothetical protein
MDRFGSRNQFRKFALFFGGEDFVHPDRRRKDPGRVFEHEGVRLPPFGQVRVAEAVFDLSKENKTVLVKIVHVKIVFVKIVLVKIVLVKIELVKIEFVKIVLVKIVLVKIVLVKIVLVKIVLVKIILAKIVLVKIVPVKIVLVKIVHGSFLFKSHLLYSGRMFTSGDDQGHGQGDVGIFDVRLDCFRKPSEF